MASENMFLKRDLGLRLLKFMFKARNEETLLEI